MARPVTEKRLGELVENIDTKEVLKMIENYNISTRGMIFIFSSKIKRQDKILKSWWVEFTQSYPDHNGTIYYNRIIKCLLFLFLFHYNMSYICQ